jgi:type I restriction enzyme S subunit
MVSSVAQIGRVQGGKALAARAPGVQRPYLRVANVFDGRIDAEDLATMPFTDAEFTRYQLHPDDILLNEGQSLELVGRAARYTGTPAPCAFQNSLIRVQAGPQSAPGFLERLFRHCQASGIFSMIATQTTSIAHLGVSRLARLQLSVPPLGEQVAIARFLAEKERDIEHYLATKRRMIEVLEESKCVTIRDIIRTGSGSCRKTRDAGVDWIDRAPEHWVTAPLKHRYQADLGKMLDTAKATGEHLIPYLRNVDVRWGTIRTDDLPTMDIRPSERERYTIRAGDLLLCEGRHLGRAAFWCGELPLCGYQKALHRVRARQLRLDNPRFLYYAVFYCSLTGAFHADGQENTIPHLTKDQLSNYRFLFPPREEQDAIVALLDDRFRDVDNLIATAEREIAVMEEYRTRLIADVVTGQLDVRGLG